MPKDIIDSDQLSKLKIEGYKSIASCEIELQRINILIGANGAGKSNFIGFFKLIKAILDEKLQRTVGEMGGPDMLLHFGRKKTESMSAELFFGNNGYKFTLKPTQDNRMMFDNECLWWNVRGDWKPSSGHFETYAHTQKDATKIYDFVIPAMRSWRVFHFHDTSATATVKQIHSINENEYLWHDARNLAAFLFRLKNQNESSYKKIIKAIHLVAPFFDDFYLRPSVNNIEFIQLEWKEKNQDTIFNASALSDGTLRFMCLATVLLQPEEFMPSTIIIDEPELGLHPYAISVLASLIKVAATQHQIIVSTQSVELINEFDPEDLIIVDKDEHRSVLRRLDLQELEFWLEEYSLGDIWKKNLIGGRPS